MVLYKKIKMTNQNLKTSIYAISILAGTIIGVGLFGLPYIAVKVGPWVILAYFLFLGAVVILIHQFFGELALETPDFKRLPGFAKIYLGKWGEKTAFISTILGLFGAILAYLIVGGQFLQELLSPIFGGDAIIYTVLYFIIGAVIIYSGIKAIAKVEFWGLILFFLILLAIFFCGQGVINIGNLFIGNWELGIGNLFLPYGAILFSLWGAALIPEIEELLGKQKRVILKIIPIAILIPIIVYLFFIYLILGITGSQTTEFALTGLKIYLGDGIVSLALLFGLVTTFTSFLTIGLTLKKVLWYDLKLNKNFAWLITCFVPLVLYLVGLKNFIAVIGFVGGVMLAVDGILILLMYNKMKPKRKLINYALILVFLVGIIYSLVYFF